jgi:Leucine-rich repeat (LRR) protein
LDIENFNASYRNLKSIEQLSFQGYDMSKIKKIRLNNNKIQETKTNGFLSFVNLTELYLNQNLIEAIEYSSFNGLMSLSILDLSGNKLKNLLTGTFHGLTNLKYLNLANNQIKNADFNNLPFLGLINLLSLDLSGNNLQNIFSFTLSNLSKLKILNLKQANIEFIDKQAFNNGFGLCLSESKTTSIYIFGNAVANNYPNNKNEACYLIYKDDEKISEIKLLE